VAEWLALGAAEQDVIHILEIGGERE
jgi:hypothetical protein